MAVSRCVKEGWKALHQPRVYLTVEPVLLVFMFAQFMTYSSFQGFLHSRLCERDPNCTMNSTTTPCQNDSSTDDVLARTSHWVLYVNIATGVPSILLSIFYGGLSDLIGRRPFIILPVIGAILNTTVVLVAIYIPSTPLEVLLVGAFCNGVYGNYSVINFAAYSYASDVSASSGRTRQIGILESMTYLGATLSQIIGGLWVEKTQAFYGPFWCILACYLAVLLYVLLALPESLKLNNHNKRTGYFNSFTHDSRFKKLKRQLRTISSNVLRFFLILFSNWKLALLVLTFFVVEINFVGIVDVVIIYSLGKPLCWSFDIIGYFLASKVFLNGLAALVVLPVLVYAKVHDGVIVLVGLVSGAAALVTMGVASHTWIMFLAPALGAMRGCVVPCLRSMLSKVVPSDKQGVLFSGVSIVEASCTLLASLIYNALYPATMKIHPGLCFFVMAAALLIPFILILALHLARNRQPFCCLSVPSEKRPLLTASQSNIN